MKPSDDLFTLIKSLSQSEKRYFKVYASRHVIGESNNYVKLFDALEGQKTYDEDRIKEKFKNEKFIRQLAVTKNYLYRLILKSVSGFENEKYAVSKTNELIHFVKILNQKSLVSQAFKFIEKAYSAADTYELYPQMLEILNLKLRMLGALAYSYENELEFQRVFERQSLISKKLANIRDYSMLASKLIMHERKDTKPRSESDEKEEVNLLKSTLLRNEENAITFESKNIFFNITLLPSLRKGDWNKIYETSRNHLDYIESKPHLLSEHIERYILVLADNLGMLKNLRRYDEFLELLNKYRSLPVKYKNYIEETNRNTITIISYFLEISAYIDTANFEKGTQIVDEAEATLNRLGEKVNKFRSSRLCILISTLFFITRNYDDALKWLNKILNDTSSGIPSDIRSNARILNLLIHLELNDFDLLEYSIRSAYRSLSKINKLYEFEKIILNFIRHSFKFKTHRDFIDALHGLRKELESLLPHPYERKPVLDLYMIQWIDSKLKNRPLADIMKESVKRKIEN
jgi:hypothetical protein